VLVSGRAEPLGGVLIVGAQTLTYHNGKTYKAIPIQTTRMCAYGVIDENGCVPPPKRSPCATSHSARHISSTAISRPI
jgi:hypothetical protein